MSTHNIFFSWKNKKSVIREYHQVLLLNKSYDIQFISGEYVTFIARERRIFFHHNFANFQEVFFLFLSQEAHVCLSGIIKKRLAP